MKNQKGEPTVLIGMNVKKQRLAGFYFSSLIVLLVGTAGFEPATPCPPDKYATRLRYAPSLTVKQWWHYKSNRRADEPRFTT
jgi:hypothetical protein